MALAGESLADAISSKAFYKWDSLPALHPPGLRRDLFDGRVSQRNSESCEPKQVRHSVPDSDKPCGRNATDCRCSGNRPSNEAADLERYSRSSDGSSDPTRQRRHVDLRPRRLKKQQCTLERDDSQAHPLRGLTAKASTGATSRNPTIAARHSAGRAVRLQQRSWRSSLV